MTFISAIRVTNGILVSADSLEVHTGAIARWDDFEKILKEKNIDEENSENKLTPKEISEIFKPERIKNKKGVQKIFPLSDKSILLVAGNATINNKDITIICEELETTIKEKNIVTAQNINQLVYDKLKKELDEDKMPQEHKEQCEYLLCIRENNIFSIKYRNNKNGKKNLSSVGNENIKHIVNIGGSIGMAKGGLEINNYQNFAIPTPMKAFRLSKSLMELAILTEELTQEIPSIGGDIYYFFLHDNGWDYIYSESDLFRIK